MRTTDSGFVLATVPVKETDLIVTVFSRHSGKLSIYAKGANKANSKRKFSLQALNLVRFSCSQPKQSGQLPFLQELKLENSFDLIKAAAHYHAECFLLTEMLIQMLTDQEDETTFALLTEVCLAPKTASALQSFVYLSLKLLNTLGFLPQLNYCVASGDKLMPTDAIMRSQESAGYRKIGQKGEGEDNELMRLAKVQLYLQNTTTTFEKFCQLNLSTKDLLELAHTQAQWAEQVIEKPLKSKYLLESLDA